MDLNRTGILRIIRLSVIAVVALLIVAYAVWRSLNYARGPEIDISEPLSGSSIHSSTALIRGRAVRVNGLSLNGNPLSISETGDFSVSVVIFPGINVETFRGSDQFGRNMEKQVIILGVKDGM